MRYLNMLSTFLEPKYNTAVLLPKPSFPGHAKFAIWHHRASGCPVPDVDNVDEMWGSMVVP